MNKEFIQKLKEFYETITELIYNFQVDFIRHNNKNLPDLKETLTKSAEIDEDYNKINNSRRFNKLLKENYLMATSMLTFFTERKITDIKTGEDSKYKDEESFSDFYSKLDENKLDKTIPFIKSFKTELKEYFKNKPNYKPTDSNFKE